ncbi:MAG: polysaccharide deacetylase [Aquificae bacterium]|nr:polysaccharide deacetylase [Aquificota bacterium]
MKRTVFILFLFVHTCLFGGEVKNYRVVSIPFVAEGERYLAIRQFLQEGKEKLLAVNVESLATRIFEKSKVKRRDFPLNKSRYFKLLRKSVKDRLENGGIGNGGGNGYYLTVDLCPSSKENPFELEAVKLFIKKGHRNIAFAVSGRWFEKNIRFVRWILQQEKAGNLKPIWINHSYTHFYSPKLPYEKNFLLKEGTDLFFEITEVEKLLIKNNITPSVFFRFPGLVADLKLRREVAYRYGLIALGSDSWLAKGEMPEKGSIILIHGNKNEPAGIRVFRRILGKEARYLPITGINP